MKETEEFVRIRKDEIKKGVRTQKMMSFRIDYENAEWLETTENKGRTINRLIAEARAAEGRKKK